MVLITVAAATLCISPPLIAQQQCGVTANLVLVGRDTITGQYGPIPRCIYDVYLNNSRNDIAQVFCTPDSPSVIWWANAGPPTWATGNSLPHFWFIPYGGVYSTNPNLKIGQLIVSGPAPQSVTIKFLNPNNTLICSQKAVGQCGSGQQIGQQGCLTHKINISTGFDPSANAVLPPSFPPYTDIKDPLWIVVSDPIPSTIEPRLANTISHSCWGTAPLPGSQWIAVYNSPSNSTNGVYRFRRCFCVEGPSRGILDLNVLADDVVDSILFNGVKVTNQTTGLTNYWFQMPPRRFMDTVALKAGKNCIEVFVRNTNEVCFGLDIAGNIMMLPSLSPVLIADTCCQAHQCWITGQKFHDLNCNSKIDQGEPVLSGWTITATPSGGGSPITAVTGSDGWYTLQVPPGTYILTEQLQSGYTQSAGGPYVVTIAQGQVLQYDFLNCTAPLPCDTIGKPQLDSGCCQFTIPLFPATSLGGITSISWSLVGGTMESIVVPLGCSASFPNPYGTTSGTITFSPPCTASPLNLMMEVSPTTTSGMVTLILTINHGQKACYDTLQLRCARAPLLKCDSLTVTPFIWTGLNLSGRTFTIFNTKIPASPIQKVLIQLVPDPDPASTTLKWNGGGLSVDGGSRSWGAANSGTPYYSTVTMDCGGVNALQGAAATTSVKFNLGVDYTLNWKGTVLLTVVHCDGDSCHLRYDWCAYQNPKLCGIIPVPIDISLLQPTLRLISGRTRIVDSSHAIGFIVVRLDSTETRRGVRLIAAGAKLTKADAARVIEGVRSLDDNAILIRVGDARDGEGEPNIYTITPLFECDSCDSVRYIIELYDSASNPIESKQFRAVAKVTSIESQMIEGRGTEGELIIVPNPSGEEVTLRFTTMATGQVMLEVVDVLGQVVFRWSDYLETPGIHSIEMNTEKLPSGRYQVRISLPNQQLLTGSLVIVR